LETKLGWHAVKMMAAGMHTKFWRENFLENGKTKKEMRVNHLHG
jgi:hypothetical protein